MDKKGDSSPFQGETKKWRIIHKKGWNKEERNMHGGAGGMGGGFGSGPKDPWEVGQVTINFPPHVSLRRTLFV